jgi:hypothetical protein
MVVAQPQYCPYCGWSFIAPTQSPAVDLAANPYAEIPPARNIQRPAPLGVIGQRPQPSSPLVLNRPQPKHINTTWERAVGTTGGILTLAVAAVAILFWNLFNPNHSADQWLSNALTGHCYLDQASNAECPYYASYMAVLITVIPMAAVAAYWFSLRRLFQEWAPWVWLKTIALAYCFLIVFTVALGALSDPHAAATFAGTFSAGNPIAFLAAFPGFFILLLLVALACSGVGIAFGYYFARWPIERIRHLRSSAWVDLGLAVAAGGAALIAQYLLYIIFDGHTPPFTRGYWWLPLAAILVAAYACWSALRPSAQPKEQ